MSLNFVFFKMPFEKCHFEKCHFEKDYREDKFDGCRYDFVVRKTLVEKKKKKKFLKIKDCYNSLSARDMML